MPVYIISAPSGSGKTTLVGELFRQVPRLRFSVSYTTRAPRGSEQDGREYYFVGRARFEAMIAGGELLEHADVFGNYYGTALRFVEEAERAREDLVLDIDVQGALQVKQRLPAAVSIFIAPPDRATLAWRLTSRGLDAEAVIEKRLLAASREIGAYNRYEFVVINDRLPESVSQLCAIVLCQRGDAGACQLANACRLEGVSERLRPVLESFGVAAPPPARRS